MDIKSLKNFYSVGSIKRPMLFIEMYGRMPSSYSCSYDDEDVIFDIYKADSKFFKEHYDNVDVYGTSCRQIEDEIKRKHKDGEIEYNRYNVYRLDDYVAAETTVIFNDFHLIVTFDNCSVEVLYDMDSLSQAEVEYFIDEFMENLPKTSKLDDEKPEVNLVSYSPSGYYCVDAEINSVEIDIDKNYNDDFKPVYDDIIGFLSSDERNSGLVVLNGEPGTGKTMLIRHIINHVKKNFILIPPSIAQNLSSPEFITFLMKNVDSIFILEDCETIITNRMSTSLTASVSSILNMSDGLMSDVFNGKFICTFNADIASVDEAILRKGRCFANYKFEKLCKEKTKALLHDQGIDLQDDEITEMTLADIYNYDVKNVKGAEDKKKIGF